MRIRRLLVTALMALGAAAVITWASAPMSATERIVRIEATEALPHLEDELERWPVDVNAILLDYAGDQRLVLAAQLALASYPEAAATVLGHYGTAPEFKRILRRYGASVVLPIHYFLQHDSLLLHLRHRATTVFDDDDSAATSDATLTSVERGWYAVDFIESEGHDFLGQFVLDSDDNVSWVQTERFATGAKRFFTSGLTSLEAKWRRDQHVGAADYARASVDVLVPVAAFRIARVARTAQVTRVGGPAMRLSARTVGAGATLATAGYLAMNPSLIGDVAHGIAEALALPGWLVEFGIWFLLLLPVLLIARGLYRWLIRPIRRLLMLTIAVLRWVHAKLAPPPPASE
jgi:hypothetical protein